METTKIDALLERHEILKLKWLQLWEQDLFNWVMLWEEMADCIDCYKIADAIKKAYELGKSWEELEIEKIEENDINSKLYH